MFACTDAEIFIIIQFNENEVFFLNYAPSSSYKSRQITTTVVNPSIIVLTDQPFNFNTIKFTLKFKHELLLRKYDILPVHKSF